MNIFLVLHLFLECFYVKYKLKEAKHTHTHTLIHIHVDLARAYKNFKKEGINNLYSEGTKWSGLPTSMKDKGTTYKSSYNYNKERHSLSRRR